VTASAGAPSGSASAAAVAGKGGKASGASAAPAGRKGKQQSLKGAKKGGDDNLLTEYSRLAPSKADDDDANEEIIEEHSEEYLEQLKHDPQLLISAFGMPRTPDTLAVAHKVVSHFKAEKEPAPTLSFPRSVEEIYKRLNAEDTPTARETIREMDKRSPLALAATHRLILEAAKTNNINECYEREFRVAARLLKRPDTLAAIEHRVKGGSGTPSWGSKPLAADVDALLARLPDYHELSLPLRHNYNAAAMREQEQKEWEEKYAQYLESGEGHGYFGTLMRQRYYWT